MAFADCGRCVQLLHRSLASCGCISPSRSKFKDHYIAIPKKQRLHQSPHSTLFEAHSTSIEVQLRFCCDMHKIAESGVASHWMYKTGDDSINQAQLRTHEWL